jgi:hypothetical protein
MKEPYQDTQDTTVEDLANKIRNGEANTPPIRIVEKNGQVYTLDNRRLYAHQQAGVPVEYQKLDQIPKRQRFKFSTDNDGTSIQVR